MLSGLPGAIALVRAVRADPSAPLAAAVVGPGGSGKSAVVGSVFRFARRAGVPTRRVLPGDDVPLPGQDAALLVVDDAHLLDEAALRALTDFADDEDARLIVTSRPWPRPRTLSTLLVTLGRGRAPTTLAPLTPAGIAERAASVLLGSPCPPPVVAALARLTGGHLAVVDRVLAGIRDAGFAVVSAAGIVTGEVPAGVVDLVRHEVEGLDDETRRFMLALAVGASHSALLADVVGVDRTTLDVLHERARSSGLLLPVPVAADMEGPAGQTDRLPPMVRRALLRLGPTGERIELEKRVAEQALGRGGSVLAPARRLLGAGLRGADVTQVFTAAGDEALSSEPHLAEAFYADAVVAGAAPGSVVLRRAEAAALAGNLDTAVRLADPVTARGRDAESVRAVTVVAVVMSHRGWGHTAAEMLADVPHLSSWAVPGLVACGRLDQARQAAAQAGPGPGGASSTTLRSAVALAAGGVLASLGSTGDAATAALSDLVRAASLIEPVGADALLLESPAALAALVALHVGDLELADSVLRRAVDAATGGPALAPRHHLLRAWVAMLRGDVAGVREHVGAARGTRDGFEPRDELPAAAIEIGVARRAGNSAALRAAWGRAREALVRQPVDLFSLLPLGEIVVGAARLNEQAALRHAWDAAEAVLAALGNPPLWRTATSWYGLAAALTAENVPDAARHLEVLTDLGEHHPLATALAGAARAWLASLSGDVDAVAVESAARALHQMGWTWDAARIAGEVAIRTRDRKAMATLLACARSLADTGRPAADGTSAQPPQVAPTSLHDESGDVTLSDREREVALLVLAGLTHRQIGARLYISSKTVEHHVARMRQRLGSTSRGELFAHLRELVDQP